jgi:hypothetical protein
MEAKIQKIVEAGVKKGESIGLNTPGFIVVEEGWSVDD